MYTYRKRKEEKMSGNVIVNFNSASEGTVLERERERKQRWERSEAVEALAHAEEDAEIG